MKKYKTSKFYTGVYIFGLLFIVPLLIIALHVWVKEGADWGSVSIAIVCILGVVLIVYQLFFDFQASRFSVDINGITMYVGLKKWYHAWLEIRDCGIISVSVGDGRTFWIYFSERTLTIEEKKDFLRKTRRDLANIAFFQYNTDVLQEVLPSMPDEIADGICNRVREIDPQMTWIEKLYHK